MKEKQYKNIIVILIFLGLLLTIGTSYALWQITLKQADENKLTTSCFRINFKDKDSINLTDAYPMSDEEGKKLKPYTFTITNTCNTHATYQVNLEILNNTTLENIGLIKTSFNEKSPSILTDYLTVDNTLENAITSRKLENGYLFPNEEKTFTLNLWICERIENQEDIINKMFNSKVTIITSFLKEKPSYASVITNCSNNGYKMAECMLDNSKYDTENLVFDSTSDNNLRYVGKNPNNYIDFNNEKWRIIGVMNNVEDITGKTSSHLKIVRDTSIGEYSWDSSASNINDGYGINEWSQADLMKLMNPGFENEAIGGSLYWNRKSGTCYAGMSNAVKSCNFETTCLTEEYKEMIDDVIWHLGSNSVSDKYNNLASEFYEFERGEITGKTCNVWSRCNDTVERTTKWLGKVGIIYVSDYAYATNGESKRDTCLDITLYNWNNSNSYCYNDDYLYKGVQQFSLSPFSNPLAAGYVFSIQPTFVATGRASLVENVYPSLYLKENVKITSGDGSNDDPYHLEFTNN